MGAINIGQATPYIEAFAMARGAASMIFHVIDRVPDIDSSSEEGLRPDSSDGVIELKGVVFNYPSRPDVKVRRSLTMTDISWSFCARTKSIITKTKIPRFGIHAKERQVRKGYVHS